MRPKLYAVFSLFLITLISPVHAQIVKFRSIPSQNLTTDYTDYTIITRSIRSQNPLSTLLYSQDFENPLGSEWQLEDGWQVVAVEGGYALQGEGHRWASLNLGPWGDVRVRFRLKLGSPGALHANLRNIPGDQRYYIGLRDFSYISRQLGGVPQDSLAEGSGLTAGWHQMEISALGSDVNVSADGKSLVHYSDPQPLGPGYLAFEVLEGTVWIDDLEVWGASSSAPPAAAPTPAEQPAPTAAGSSAGELTWVRTGGPLGGLGYDVRMDPRNPDRMYVTDAFSGVFISENGGQTWLPSNQGITARSGTSNDAIPVFCLTIDPNNPDIIWTGTQFQSGIFKSHDAGRTWTKMNNGIAENEGITFRGFSVDPRDSSVVYAAAEVSSWKWAGQQRWGREFDLVQGVVYKTTDAGENWQVVWRGDNLARYVWIDPRDSNVLTISTGIFDREAANSDWQTQTPGGVGVLKSRDGGKTWSQMNNGLNNLYVGSLFMDSQNPDILLAGTGNNTYPNNSGVYLSTDGGEHWQQTLSGRQIESVEISSTSPNIAYAGGEDVIAQSEDGGLTWQTATGSSLVGGQDGWGPPGVRAGFPIDLQADPRNPQRLFANAYGGGNFLSVDGGRTWTVASRGYTGVQTRDIAVDPQAPGHLVDAARSGIFASFDGGDTWTGLNFPDQVVMGWNSVAIDPANPQHIVAGNNWNGLVQTHNGGQRWEGMITIEEMCGLPSSIVFAPSDPQLIYAGVAGYKAGCPTTLEQGLKGFWFSRDGGATWNPSTDNQYANMYVHNVAVDPQDKMAVYVITRDDGILKSIDGGMSWVQIHPGWPNLETAFVAVNPNNPAELYTGGLNVGLHRSQNGGQSWQQIAAGIAPEATVPSVVFQPGNPQVVFLSDTKSGVYRSDDGGSTWTILNQGLTTRAVNRLAFSADGLHLYAASEGGGVFRLDLNGQPPMSAAPPAAPASVQTSAPPGTDSLQIPQVGTVPPASAPGPSQGVKLSVVAGLLALAVAASLLALAVLGGAVWVIFMRKR